MRVVMTLLARDEADIVEAVLAFHLAAGVDFIVATDHASTDGTGEILERYERLGRLHLIRESGTDFRQTDLVTRMARTAATDFGADWVLNVDADEFWWPRRSSWKELLGAIPDRFTVVRGAWRHFAPRAEEQGYWAERMTLRIGSSGPLTEREDPFHASAKVVHRADPHLRVGFGNHDVALSRHVVLRGWYPFEVLHFPLRSRAQAQRKFERRADRELERVPHIESAIKAIREGDWNRRYGRYTADEQDSGHGYQFLTEDTRLRNALRLLAGTPVLSSEPSFGADGSFAPLNLVNLDDSDDLEFVEDTQPLQEREGDVRFEQRIKHLEGRVADLERGIAARMVTRVKRAAHGR